MSSTLKLQMKIFSRIKEKDENNLNGLRQAPFCIETPHSHNLVRI